MASTMVSWEHSPILEPERLGEEEEEEEEEEFGEKGVGNNKA